MVNPSTYVMHPFVRIPGFPDYAINRETGEVYRVTPKLYRKDLGLTASDGTIPQEKWGRIRPFCLTEGGMGQVMLMPRGGKRGYKRSIKNILKEVGSHE